MGRAQAEGLAEALAPEAFDLAVASDLRRAFETAQTIASRHAPLKVRSDRRLRELYYGQWEGLNWQQIVDRHPSMRGVSVSSPSDYVIEDGESFAQLQRRVAEVLAELRASNAGNVLVVTHAGPLHAMLRTLMPEKQDDFDVRLQPASITRVRIDDERAELIALNETAHLRDY